MEDKWAALSGLLACPPLSYGHRYRPKQYSHIILIADYRPVQILVNMVLVWELFLVRYSFTIHDGL
jgi:hypothetical protein